MRHDPQAWQMLGMGGLVPAAQPDTARRSKRDRARAADRPLPVPSRCLGVPERFSAQIARILWFSLRQKGQSTGRASGAVECVRRMEEENRKSEVPGAGAKCATALGLFATARFEGKAWARGAEPVDSGASPPCTPLPLDGGEDRLGGKEPSPGDAGLQGAAGLIATLVAASRTASGACKIALGGQARLGPGA